MGELGIGIIRNDGMNSWRAGCGESRTSGSEGGPEKPTHREMDRALRSDPYIAKGKAGHVVRVTVYYLAERSSGGPDACPNSSWLDLSIVGLVNGVKMHGEGRQSCPPDTYDCSASTTLWLDLDAAEADNPGQFKGKPLNIEITGNDFTVPLGCKLLHSITGSAELVKKGKVKKKKK